jgi:hypothetical protein
MRYFQRQILIIKDVDKSSTQIVVFLLKMSIAFIIQRFSYLFLYKPNPR